jgi:hypothetical protein
MDDVVELAQSLRGSTLATYRWVVEEGHVNHFRSALRATGADFVDDDRVPIAFSVTSGLWMISHQGLLEAIGMDTDRVVHGEQSFEILIALVVGREYVVSHNLVEVSVKSGRRAGRMLLVAIETLVQDLGGSLCVREVHTSIQLEAS